MQLPVIQRDLSGLTDCFKGWLSEKTDPKSADSKYFISELRVLGMPDADESGFAASGHPVYFYIIKAAYC